MLNIEDPRAQKGLALFNLGFRPFFLGAAIFSVVATVVWMGIYVFGWSFGLHTITPVIWHAHEMIFGYSLAVIAGFLLTAVTNWTKRPTLHGLPLLLLLSLWLAARVLPFVDGSLSLQLLAVIDNLFILFLLLATATPIVKARQWQHAGIILILLLLLASNLLFYSSLLEGFPRGVNGGLYSGLYLIMALIFVMGRRVIPFFIEKGVGYQVQLTNWFWLDISSLLLFLLFWISDLVVLNQALTAVLAGILCLLHALRMVGWHTPGIWKKPLLWVLYLAYGSLVFGFALKAAVVVFGLSPNLAIHAFAFGGIGMMTIGMMSRVALGHTGRNVFEPPPILFWVFAILGLGAFIRVVMPMLAPAQYVQWIGVSQLLWIVAFSLFFYLFLPILSQPRTDGRDG